jgi:predicted amidophosphoribosyltransferase
MFGRLLLGWLETHADRNRIDLIVPNPGFGARQHTERIIESAAREDIFDEWPFDHAPWAITKPRETQASAGKTWREKLDAAKAHADSLIIDRERADGRRIVLFDDIATTLLTQEFVARRLKAAGASQVVGLVVARVLR